MASPSVDVDQAQARGLFPTTGAWTAKTIAPLGAQFDALVDLLETVPRAFAGRDPAIRQQQVAMEREAFMRALPRDQEISLAKAESEAARRIDSAWQAQQRTLAEKTTQQLQAAHTALAEQHQRDVQAQRVVPDAYAHAVTAELTEDEQRALDPKSLLHSTDKLVARQLVETRALRQDMLAMRSAIDEQTAATEIPRDTQVGLLLRYAADGTSAALKRRADFLLGLVLDGSLPLPDGLLPSTLRGQVDAIQQARVPASVRQAAAAEPAFLEVLHQHVARASVLLGAGRKNGFPAEGLFTEAIAQRDADQRARARLATSKAWAPVLKRARGWHVEATSGADDGTALTARESADEGAHP